MAITHLQPLTDTTPEVTAQLWHRLVLVYPIQHSGYPGNDHFGHFAARIPIVGEGC